MFTTVLHFRASSFLTFTLHLHPPRSPSTITLTHFSTAPSLQIQAAFQVLAPPPPPTQPHCHSLTLTLPGPDPTQFLNLTLTPNPNPYQAALSVREDDHEEVPTAASSKQAAAEEGGLQSAWRRMSELALPLEPCP